MITKSHEFQRKKQAQHLISVDPDIEDVSLVTDDDLISQKKEQNLITWIILHRTLLILCSLVVALLVWHRWSMRALTTSSSLPFNGFSSNSIHWEHHVFSDSLHDSHRSALTYFRPRQPEIQNTATILPAAATTGTSKKNSAVTSNDSSMNMKNSDTKSNNNNVYSNNHDNKNKNSIQVPFPGCLTELPNPDLRKHLVPPPAGDVTLVCCNTTKGILNIEVHPTWAPHGAKRFLTMVQDNFFSTKVPMFRALKGFLIQFGLAGDPKVHQKYHAEGNLPDDPTWLPWGPRARQMNGINRYQTGYLAYAGAGQNSRGTQLIVALAENKLLGGGCPWEVPWGQVVGQESLNTLKHFYTGYGEKVSQGKIMNQGIKYVEENFPKVDAILECHVVAEHVQWHWKPTAENTNLNIDISDYHITDPKPEEEV